MQVVSVNVGKPQWVQNGDSRLLTGIFKTPAPGAVKVCKENVEGDGQADLVHHGGVDKAVYAYPHEHYARWANELSRDDFTFGQFGENLTTAGVLEEDLCIGDTLRVGSSLLQVSQPRVPCAKLGVRMNDPHFVKQFLDSLRCGFYLRVLEAGEIAAGSPVAIVSRDAEGFTVRDIMHLHFFDKENRSALDRACNLSGLSKSWRESLGALRQRLS